MRRASLSPALASQSSTCEGPRKASTLLADVGPAASFQLGSNTCLADAEYSVAIPGLFVLLASFVYDGRRAVDGGPEKAKALIQAFMDYVFFMGHKDSVRWLSSASSTGERCSQDVLSAPGGHQLAQETMATVFS